VTECILNNERCFLAEDAWIPVFQSLVDEGSLVSDRSQLVVDLSRYLSHASGMLKDVTSLVCGQREDTCSSASELNSQLLAFRNTMSEWRKQYDSVYRLAQTIRPNEIVMATHWAVMGIYLVGSLFSARLLSAISNFEDRILLEEQCQEFADQTIVIAERERGKSLEVGLGLAQKVRISEATKATASEWIEPPRNLDALEDGNGFIEKWKFVNWCSLFGRRTS
jgi:hypothetical protein